jgi:hypothetical protein
MPVSEIWGPGNKVVILLDALNLGKRAILLEVDPSIGDDAVLLLEDESDCPTYLPKE